MAQNIFSMVQSLLMPVSRPLDEWLGEMSPTWLIVGTALAVWSLPKMAGLMSQGAQTATNFYADAHQRGVRTAGKQLAINTVYNFVQWQPFAAPKRLLAKELDKEKRKMFAKLRADQAKYEHELLERGVVLRDALPSTPVDLDEFKPLLREAWGNYKPGRTSGARYADWSAEDLDSLGEFDKAFGFTNPLHTSSWPLVQLLHNKVMSMGAKLLNDANAYGIMTSGGTSSIVEACYAYVKHAREVLGIAKPRIIVPETAHVAFDTAAELMDFELVKIPVDSVTKQVDVDKMRRAINRNTVLLVGSAPNYPYGIADDVKAIAALAKRRGIGCHVDSCLGGFITMFAQQAGFKDIPIFDFRLPGVTSISADWHKYGAAPKGTSGLWMRRGLPWVSYLTRAYFKWLGGLYVKPSLEGSRSGGMAAKTYHAANRKGVKGYEEQARGVIRLTREMADVCRRLEGVSLCGDPQICAFAFEGDGLPTKDSIYVICEWMNHKKGRGWELTLIEGGIHMTITAEHVAHRDQIVRDFEDDLQAAVTFVKEHPTVKPKGTAKAYGKLDTGTVPERALQGIGHGYQEVITTDTSQYIRWLGEDSKIRVMAAAEEKHRATLAM